jgi:WD40 repeat protein
MGLNYRIFLPCLLLLAIFVTGCGESQLEPAVSSQEATDTPADPVVEKGIDPAGRPTDPTPTSAGLLPSIPSLPKSALSEKGPWWLFFTGEGMWADALWAADTNGAGFSKLASDQIIIPRDMRLAASPKDGIMAFITADDFQLRGLALNLLSFPQSEMRILSPLSSPETEKPADADPAIRPPEPLVAITEEVSLAWSPDGRSLAFTAAFEGPTSDLYLYSLEEDSITRLTDGPSQAIRPVWSPDGENILHFGVETLGSGAGYTMSGAWVAKADGSEVLSLFDPSESGDEFVVGWLSDNTFVVYSFNIGLGQILNLRTVNLETQDSKVIWSGGFIDAALDPDSGTLLVAAGPDSDRSAGLYRLATGDSKWQPIVEDIASRLRWSPELGLFLAQTENGVLALSTQGDFIDLNVPDGAFGFPAVAPATKQIAWTGSSLWLGSLTDSIDQPPRLVYEQPASHASWDPEGQVLIFYSDGQLLVAEGPEFAPAFVADGLTIHQPVLIRP